MTDANGGKQPMADVILVARQFLRGPDWVLKIAWKLGLDVWWSSQFMRAAVPQDLVRSARREIYMKIIVAWPGTRPSRLN
jgi:2,4-dienoyl-CoA reductase-like NADH-dependent reductase (Old Yellow Enzyme family)